MKHFTPKISWNFVNITSVKALKKQPTLLTVQTEWEDRYAMYRQRMRTFTRVTGETSLTLTHETFRRVNAATTTSTRDLQTVRVLRKRTSTYRVIQKSKPPSCCHDFIKYWPIFQILSLTHSAVNLQKARPHHTLVSQHYLPCIILMSVFTGFRKKRFFKKPNPPGASSLQRGKWTQLASSLAQGGKEFPPPQGGKSSPRYMGHIDDCIVSNL